MEPINVKLTAVVSDVLNLGVTKVPRVEPINVKLTVVEHDALIVLTG